MPDRALAIAYATLPDAELATLAQRGHREAFRHIMQRGNQRLFRVARAVLNDDAEAEDALQDAYTHAFTSLATFRGEANIFTWLTRIVLNEAYRRLRQRHPTVAMEHIEAAQQDDGVLVFPSRYGSEDPASHAARSQLRELAEHAIEALPEPFRVVFILREIEECSVEETAAALDIRPETVKTRLHRARRLLRAALHEGLSAALADAFPFLGPRCARITEVVLDRLGAKPAEPDTINPPCGSSPC